MTTYTMQEDAGLKRRNIRLGLVLALMAIGFYVAFILMSIFVY